MAPQSRIRLELISTYTTSFTMFVRTSDFVQCIVLVGIKVLVAFVAVVMFVSVLLVVLHAFLSVERHAAVCVRAFETPNGLEGGGHLSDNF